MEPAVAVFTPDMKVAAAVEKVREWTHDTLITYGYVVNDDGGLMGVLAMRDLLAAFLPVLAGQFGNTGCQSLAVTIRGLTLGEFKSGVFHHVLVKETLLGAVNGAVVGVVAAIAMIAYAITTGAAQPVMLGLVVLLANVLVLS